MSPDRAREEEHGGQQTRSRSLRCGSSGGPRRPHFSSAKFSRPAREQCSRPSHIPPGVYSVVDWGPWEASRASGWQLLPIRTVRHGRVLAQVDGRRAVREENDGREINRDPGILNQRNVARRFAGGAGGRAAHHSGGANRRTQGWAARPRARRRSPPGPRWIDQFTAGPRGEVCPRRVEFEGLPKTAACSPPGCLMGATPAGNRPMFSGSSKRPTSPPSSQGIVWSEVACPAQQHSRADPVRGLHR